MKRKITLIFRVEKAVECSSYEEEMVEKTKFELELKDSVNKNFQVIYDGKRS